jgi:two-component system, cell cycle response regulator
MRRTDMVARYGGEEFVVMLPGTTPEAALERVEALRQQVANTPIHLPDGQAISLNFSAGIAGIPADSATMTLKALLTCADTRLLAAKRAGRGQCIGRGTFEISASPSSKPA